jgi:hypothetical protein
MNTVSETPQNLKPHQDLENLRQALATLEQTAHLNRVTVEGYRAVESAAFSLFLELLRPLPAPIAREAQSAVNNALFLIDLERMSDKK